MRDKRKEKDLINNQKLWHKLYSIKQREWFTKKIINFNIDKGVSGQSLYNKVEADIKESKNRVYELINAFKIGRRELYGIINNNNNNNFKVLEIKKIKVRLIYGVIGLNPEFALAQYKSYLDFILNRRYRSIVTMRDYVNREYFYYPSKCNNKWSINLKAKLYWEKISPNEPDDKPIPLKLSNSGKTDPVKAVEKIFDITNESECERNLFDCSYTMCIVLIDSLLVSYNKNTLMETLLKKNDKVEAYFIIANPLSITHDCFLRDRVYGLYEIKTFTNREEWNDLVIGDYVYFKNHPLLTVFMPGAPWIGEHALIIDVSDKEEYDLEIDNKRLVEFSFRTLRNGYKFSGHGMKKPMHYIEWFRKSLFFLKTQISRAANIAIVHLENIKVHGKQTQNGFVKVHQNQQIELMVNNKLQMIECDIFCYTTRFEYDCWTDPKSTEIGIYKIWNINAEMKTESWKRPETDFVICHHSKEDLFFIDYKKDIKYMYKDGKLVLDSAIQIIKENNYYWSIPYFDQDETEIDPQKRKKPKKHKILKVEGNQLSEIEFTTKDFFNHDLARFLVVRPYIDFSADYLDKLHQLGAIKSERTN
ncbi:hypothetical protein EH223_18925 [candidate division KSB1 bacterium]|nr:hypothetical protein [candidate division KSB1 bacterium]RQW00377.1 MAG: hypothetical protein EH223_18925 [candidate division KSB1 bacterium]